MDVKGSELHQHFKMPTDEVVLITHHIASSNWVNVQPEDVATLKAGFKSSVGIRFGRRVEKIPCIFLHSKKNGVEDLNRCVTVRIKP